MKTIKIIEVIGIIGIMALIYLGNAQANTITEIETKTEETKEIPFELEAVEHGYIDTTSEEFRNNYLDMRTVTGYTGTANGLQLHTKDGNGYYLDTENVQDNATEIYTVTSKKDCKALYKKLLHRNGKIIIEVITGTVDDAEGNGTDAAGYYIGYDMEKFSKGDKVQSVFVYNPDNNYTDDILYRVDTLIK